MDAVSGPTQTVAIVINPTKFDDLAGQKAAVSGFARQAGWAEPMWWETDRADSGVSAAQSALAERPDLVCAMGGDGTVRAVASVLRGTAIPFGLLPGGTGNLFARNLGIPVDSPADALEIAFLGQNRAIDVGLATFDDGIERVFVVMGGVGLDADIMAQTDDSLKKRMGWGAYVVAGGATMFREGFGVNLTVDGSGSETHECLMVLACNCSSVVANIELATGALLDDGRLDLVLLRPNIVAGWVGVAIDLAARIRNGAGSLQQVSGRDSRFELDRPVRAEIDGDPVGETRSGRFRVDPGALIMRLPVPATFSSVRNRPAGPPTS